jgi:ABC-2 type transport system permease protein
MTQRRVWTIAVNEVRHAWRNHSIAVLGAVLVVLAAGATVVGRNAHRTDAAQRQRYQELVARQFADQPDRHPHRVSHYGYLVFRPRAPLGFFDHGVEGFAGTSVFLEAHRQNTANFSAAAQGGHTERFGELTLAAVVQLFLPLFVFGLAGVSITREREAGTLPLLLCQGASWSAVVWGKFLGTLLVIAAIVTPAVAISAGWLVSHEAVTWDADVRVRAAILTAVHVAFLAACTALGVTVSSWSRTSRQAMVVLVALWFGSWVVLPRVLPVIATALHPTPARSVFDAEVEARVRELGDSHNPDDPVFRQLREDTLLRYGVSRLEELPINYGGLVMREAEQRSSTAFQEHRQRLLAVYDRQGRIVEMAAVVSPFLAVRSLSMALSGSDGPHLQEFERQAEAFRVDLIQSLNALHIDEVDASRDRYAQVTGGAPSRQRIDAAFFDGLPTFHFQPPSASWALAQRPIGLLASGVGLLGLAAALAWTSARRPIAL